MSYIQHIYIITIILYIICNQPNSETIICKKDENCKCSNLISEETCTLDCSRQPDACKDSSLTCRSGDPCIIKCENVATCQDGTIINAQTATDVTIICSGSDACKTDINICCGTGHCHLQCLTSTSCIDWGRINVTSATSFTCSGVYCPTSIPQQFTISPTHIPTIYPTVAPTATPTTHAETYTPTYVPTISPTLKSTKMPTAEPSKNPTISPTPEPTGKPTEYGETIEPSQNPTFSPIRLPSKRPSLSPTKNPTKSPSKRPSLSPTSAPTQLPAPTSRPTTSAPTRTSITANPSITPTKSPIKSSTNNPSILPTRNPSSITYTTQPTKSPAIAYPTISSSANLTINSVLRTNVPNESDTINPTKLSSVIPSVSSTKKSTLTTTVSDGITYTEKSVQESNENDISYLGLGMPLWMNAVIGFGIICCLLIVLMLCIRKRKKKSYVNFESADVNENDEQIVVRTDTHETHSNNSIKAEFSMGDLGASNSNLCEKNTFERGLMNNCVVSDILMEDIVDNMDTRGNIEMSNNNNNIVAAQGEAMDIQDSIEDINNNINDGQVMLQEIIKMANDTKVTAEGDNNI